MKSTAALEAALESLKIDAKRLGRALIQHDPAAITRIFVLGWSGPDIPSHGQLLDLVAKERGYKHFHEFRQRHQLGQAASAAEQTLWDRYRPFVATATPLFNSTNQLAPELLIEQRGDLAIAYAPFEHIHPDARVIVVGLTPGFTQASAALSAARAALAEGHEDAEALRRAKETGAFAGAIRNNLVRLLAAVDIDRVTGCAVEELFSARRELIHTTSAVRYPIFLKGENYNGSVVDNAFLRSYVEKYLGEELSCLRAPVIALGKHSAAAVELLVRTGKLDAARYLGQLPHPSGANAGRVVEALTADPSTSQYARMVADMQRRLNALSGKPRTGARFTTSAEPAKAPPKPWAETPAADAAPAIEPKVKRPKVAEVSASAFEHRLTESFTAAGFRRTHETSKKIEFTLSGRQLVIYLDRTKLDSGSIMVIMPPTLPTEKLSPLPGLEFSPEYFHSSNMRAFPRRMHRGENLIPYGRAVRVQGEGALTRLLASLVEGSK